MTNNDWRAYLLRMCRNYVIGSLIWAALLALVATALGTIPPTTAFVLGLVQAFALAIAIGALGFALLLVGSALHTLKRDLGMLDDSDAPAH